MSALGYYLHIPRDYAEYLGGLHWSHNGEAIEYADRTTFAFRGQVGMFLQGLAATRGLLHFGHVLHLLHLLGVGRLLKPAPAPVLEAAYRKVGKPLQNAGAFCGLLCRQVPSVPGDLDATAVGRQLYSGSIMSILYVSWSLDLPEGTIEVPPLSPKAFESHVLRAVEAYTPDEIEHWLRHGRGPIKGAARQLVEELESLQPRSLSTMLAQLTQRPRLSGAVPFVAQLVSALTLPPRRRTEEELPTGGYADVTTHGQPEQLLPSQFALDDMEFLRRFAENELLYFRREEPHARTQEELILLLDQGVRTWGDVRLLLSAAVFAFGKRAARRGLPLRIAGTSTAGQLLDPLEAGEEELGELLDASDLTANPALALESILETPADQPRDVVLLTHPRSLAEPDVAAAARRATGDTRLFGLSVDAEGRVELSQIKRGTPVPLTRLRVDLEQPAPAPERRSPADGPPPWRGDIEMIPFPFQLGLVGKADLQRSDFDYEGKWLFVLTRDNFLQAFKLDGSVKEVLPRSVFGGKHFTSIHAVLGVTGGCVVAGRVGNQIVAAHYDFAQRRCKTYRLIYRDHDSWKWSYFHEYHSVVARDGQYTYGVDLGTGTCSTIRLGQDNPEARAELACSASRYLVGRRGQLCVTDDRNRHEPYPTLLLNQCTGTVALVSGASSGGPFTPLADGKPLLKGCLVGGPALLHGNTLAFYSLRKFSVIATGRTSSGPCSEPWWLRVFQLPEGILIGEFRQSEVDAGFALSADGTRLARLLEDSKRAQVEVRDLSRDNVLFVTPPARCHPGFLAELGRMRLAIFVGKMTHLIEWKDARLEVSFTRAERYAFLNQKAGQWIPGSEVATLDELRRLPGLDEQRFLRAVQGNVTMLVDRLGHVAILDCTGELVCMFFAFRERLAAWMPDGTRFGHAALTGGAETPGARERIGQALFRASQLGGGVRP